MKKKLLLLLLCLMYAPGLTSQSSFTPPKAAQTASFNTNQGGNIELISFQTGYPYEKICGVQWVSPVVNILNSGADSILSIELELYKNGVLLQIINYSEPVGPFLPRLIAFNPIVLSGAVELKAVVKGVNGMVLPVPLVKEKNYALSSVSASQYLTMRIRTDNFAVENYWEITDQQGVVHAYGGNQLVGPGGGSSGAATPGPGTYANNSTILVPVELPLNGCYQLHFVDAFGDGLCNDNGSFKLYETSNPTHILAQGDCAFGDKYELFGTGNVNALEEYPSAITFKVYPNPAVDAATVAMNLVKSEQISTVLLNSMGQVVGRTEAVSLPAGDHQLGVPVSGLKPGFYFLQICSATHFFTTTVVVCGK